jgi:hypothetical protein
MTAKKDLKRRVRERQARTGESYTTARAHVVAQAEPAESAVKPSAIPVVELIDISGEAEHVGFKCSVLASPALASRVSPARVLERLRDALLATEQDPTTAVLRAVLLRGEAIARTPRQRGWWNDMRRFFERARVGIGGTTASGDMMALQVDDTMVIVQAGYVPHMPPIMRIPQRVFLSTVDAQHVFDSAFTVPR